MKLTTMEIVRGNDFVGDLVCEHCGHKQRLRNGYNDDYYHDHVLPAIKCVKCGRASNESV